MTPSAGLLIHALEGPVGLLHPLPEGRIGDAQFPGDPVSPVQLALLRRQGKGTGIFSSSTSRTVTGRVTKGISLTARRVSV